MRRLDMSLEHPAKASAVEPDRVPDYSNSRYEAYFKEKILTIANSNGQFEPALMSVCPQTGRVMYMQQYYPICWVICTDDGVQEAYIRHSFEKVMLNAQD